LECFSFYGTEEESLIPAKPCVLDISLISKLTGFLFFVILWPLWLLKENRKRGALWIFLPYYAWFVLAIALESLVGEEAGGSLMPLLAILAGVLLMGCWSQAWNGRTVLLAVVAYGTLIQLVWTFLGTFEQRLTVSLANAVLLLLVVFSLFLARLGCRGQYNRLKLTLFLLVAMLLSSMPIVVCLAYMAYTKMGGAELFGLGTMLLGSLVGGLVAGGALFLLVLSFLAVPFFNEFYRQRLCWILKLERGKSPESQDEV